MDNKTNSEADGVVSVSRSGRVRKKSSKLLDFQSPDELEKKLTKRQLNRPSRNIGGHPRPVGRPRTSDSSIHNEQNDFEFDDNDIEDDDMISSADELDEMVADMVEGVEAESFEHDHENEPKVRQSLYMSEKSNKRKILKDGKIITSKVERKDKGKSRYTAYSLWAREFRKTSKFSKNQDLDFSNASRRLGELWANVSNKEKSAWRRKAKIQATKAKARERVAPTTVNQNTPISSSFVNRPTTSRTRKLAELQKTPPPPTSPTRKRYSSHRSSTATSTPNGTSFLSSNYLADTSSSHNTTQKTQLSNTEPIDAAAHLKLLGESLNIIGERLKDHEGPIALSGSLSVLLDSILCSLGPLLCLTQFIPGLEKKTQLKSNLASTLDNIAYVMPGL